MNKLENMLEAIINGADAIAFWEDYDRLVPAMASATETKSIEKGTDAEIAFGC